MSTHNHPPLGEINPVLPEWIFRLPYQQQSVLLLGTRGPDGIAKHHPIKVLHACYRGCIFKAAYYGRELRTGESADTFMTRGPLDEHGFWAPHVACYFAHVDELPYHYHLHLMHGAQILSFKHPSPVLRDRWAYFYTRACEDMHLTPETEAAMDIRLGDWGRRHWD